MKFQMSGRLRVPRWRRRSRYPNGTWGAWTSQSGPSAVIGISRTVISKRGRFPYGSVLVSAGPGRGTKRSVRRLSGPRLLPNPFTRTVSAGSCTSCTCEGVIAGLWTEMEGEIAGLYATIPPPPVITSQVNASLARIANEMYRKASAPSFEGYLQYGELAETVASLRNPLGALRELSNELWHVIRRRGKGKSGPKLREAVSSSWLEYQFGIAPLITGLGDVIGGLVEAVSPLSPRPLAEKVMVSDTVDLGSTTTINEGLGYRYTDKTTLRVRSGCWLTNTSQVNTMAERMGLHSVSHLAAQGWALMPLSFAVDWFIGVGPLLESCRPTRGSVVGSWTSSDLYTLRTFTTWKYSTLPMSGELQLWRGTLNRTIGTVPSGVLSLGPGLFSVSQGISAALLGLGVSQSLWKKLPWH